MITAFSPAKINLYLHVTGRRDDGYHLLDTLFQFLDFGDTLEFTYSEDGVISRHDDHSFELPEVDLVVQAAEAVRDYCQCSRHGAKIRLMKQIPPGSGMGGGSSNAGVTVVALNRLWNLGLSRSSMEEICRTLGADVPLFAHGHACRATGIGDIFEDVTHGQHWYCLVIPRCPVSTAAVFKALGRIKGPAGSNRKIPAEENWCNHLEAVCRDMFPEVDEVFRHLERFARPQLNGSGSSVFLRCSSEREAHTIASSIPSKWRAIVTQSINRVPPLQF